MQATPLVEPMAARSHCFVDASALLHPVHTVGSCTVFSEATGRPGVAGGRLSIVPSRHHRRGSQACNKVLHGFFPILETDVPALKEERHWSDRSFCLGLVS